MFLPVRGIAARSCKRSPFLFVSADVQQLLPDRVLRGKTIFDVGFEEREVPHASLHQVALVVLVEVLQRLRCDRVEPPPASLRDRGLYPVLLDPEDDLILSDMEGGGQALD